MRPWTRMVFIMKSTYMTSVPANAPMGAHGVDYDLWKKQKKTLKNQCFFQHFRFWTHPAQQMRPWAHIVLIMTSTYMAFVPEDAPMGAQTAINT